MCWSAPELHVSIHNGTLNFSLLRSAFTTVTCIFLARLLPHNSISHRHHIPEPTNFSLTYYTWVFIYPAFSLNLSIHHRSCTTNITHPVFPCYCRFCYATMYTECNKCVRERAYISIWGSLGQQHLAIVHRNIKIIKMANLF